MASECLTSECPHPYEPPLYTALSLRWWLSTANDQAGELTMANVRGAALVTYPLALKRYHGSIDEEEGGSNAQIHALP